LYTFTQTVRQFVRYDVLRCLKCGDGEEYSLLGYHTAYCNRKLLSSKKPSEYFYRTAWSYTWNTAFF